MKNNLIPKRRTPFINILVGIVAIAFVVLCTVGVGQLIGNTVNHAAPGYIVQP
jgi:hypothetical protein